MNIVSILTAVAVIGVSVFALEGLSVATGGEFYLASIQNLAENTKIPGDYLQASDDTTTSTTVSGTTTATTPSTSAETVPTTTNSTNTSSVVAPATTTTQPAPSTTSGGGTIRADQTIQQPMQPITQPIMNGTRNEVRVAGDEMKDEGNQNDFVDPGEVKRVLKEISNMRSEVKRVISQNKKNASEADLAELNAVLEAANKSYTAIKNSSDEEMRSNMQEFYDGQYWERIQTVRNRLEIPKETKQMLQVIKRLEKTLATKAMQNIGLDIAKAQQKVAETKALVEKTQSAYSSGDMETASETMQEIRDGGHPGEIEGTIFRFRDIKNMVKKVKDQQVRDEVDGVLQEVVDAFNNGDYREANQAMNEYADDMQKLLNTFIKSKINNANRGASLNKINSLEKLIQSKLGNETQTQTIQTDSTQQ